jgi:hypothetical protein
LNKGIHGVYRTIEKGGVPCYTFFKALGMKLTPPRIPEPDYRTQHLRILETRFFILIIMSNLEKPSPTTMRRIYFALVRRPRSFEDLVQIIGVNEVMLVNALDFLKEKGMIISYNFTTKCVIFRMIRTLPLR